MSTEGEHAGSFTGEGAVSTKGQGTDFCLAISDIRGFGIREDSGSRLQ